MGKVIVNAIFPGEPVAQERAQRSGRRTFEAKKSRLAKKRLRWQYKSLGHKPRPALHCWLGVQLVFTCKDFGKDGDNMEKLVWDAFNGVIWHDDDQIVEWSGRKVRAGLSTPPSTRIVVYVIEGMR